jgi:hypothetical protein
MKKSKKKSSNKRQPPDFLKELTELNRQVNMLKYLKNLETKYNILLKGLIEITISYGQSDGAGLMAQRLLDQMTQEDEDYYESV